MNRRIKFRNAAFFDPRNMEWRIIHELHVHTKNFYNIHSGEKINVYQKKNERLYVIPGLIDAHLHITGNPNTNKKEWNGENLSIEELSSRTEKNLKVAAKYGITTVRDHGLFNFISLKVKQKLEKEKRKDKLHRLITSGGFLSKIGGHAENMAILIGAKNDPNDIISKLKNMGANFIKIVNDPVVFSATELKKIIEYSKKLGFMVSVHVFNDISAQLAIEAGADNLEHAGNFKKNNSSNIEKKYYCCTNICCCFRYISKSL